MQVGGDKRKRVAGAIKEEEDFEEEGEEDGKQPAKKRSSVKAGMIDPSPILKAGCYAMLLMCLFCQGASARVVARRKLAVVARPDLTAPPFVDARLTSVLTGLYHLIPPQYLHLFLFLLSIFC